MFLSNDIGSFRVGFPNGISLSVYNPHRTETEWVEIALIDSHGTFITQEILGASDKVVCVDAQGFLDAVTAASNHK